MDGVQILRLWVPLRLRGCDDVDLVAFGVGDGIASRGLGPVRLVMHC
jgi:hypothetical protein